MNVTGFTAAALALLVSATALDARAQPGGGGPAKIVPSPPPAELVGLTMTGSLVPDRGFVDDPVATDGTNLAVIVTDGAGLAEIRVVGPDGVSHATVNMAPIIPTARRLYLLGSRLFVVSDDPAGGQVTGALVDLSGKVVRRQGHATDLSLRTIGGKEVVVAYNRSMTRAGEQHQVTLFDPVTAKKIAKRGGRLLLGTDGKDRKLDFRVDYWLDDHTVAAGLHGGVWRKREDQRSPDTFALYDVVAGKWLADEPIRDLHAHARRLELLMAHPGERVFVHVPSEGGDLQLWRDGSPTAIALDPPLATYDPASARVVMRGDRAWISLVVDPVNPSAVARKKADAEYFDLFEVDGSHAVRRARIFAPKKKLTWGWSGDTLWVLEKNVGFGRGGKAIRFYRLSSG